MEQKISSKKKKEIKLKQKQNDWNSTYRTPEVPYHFWYLRSVDIQTRQIVLLDST